jgi:hypothetical protein
MEIQTPSWHNEVYPYEIHLTVKCEATEHFKQLCEVLLVKPLLIEMKLKDGRTDQDLMCSFKQETTYENIVDKAQSLSKSFRHLGYKVIRTKIETVPWHPIAPQTIGSSDRTKDRYFEAHVGVLIPLNPDQALLKTLDEWAIYCKAYKSNNLFKEYENGDSIQMYTLRNHWSFESFNLILTCFLDALKELGIETERVVIEFAVYDSNISHDENWIGG